MPPSLSVALLGVGPRGLSVLERLLIRLRDEPPAGKVAIWAVDPVEHGSGRVWRTGQPAWLTTNATAAEVTVRSPDGFVSEPTFDDRRVPGRGVRRVVRRRAAPRRVRAVRIVEPSARFEGDTSSWVVTSPAVCRADVLIEARVPPTDISRSLSPLFRQLLADGMISEDVNHDPTTGERFATGGLAVPIAVPRRRRAGRHGAPGPGQPVLP